ncbi:MAG: SRPBCC family protein [Bacteroidia bacterium]|nr:SRPBCC family protein [Bacteroidia bacterium]
MKILKRILLVLVVLIALLAVVGLFLPSGSHVNRSLTIKAAPENVYSLINNLKSWDRWSPWHKMDPNWKVTWGGPDEGNGSWYSWESQSSRVGNGKISITQSVPFDSIVTRMEFMGSDDPAWGRYIIKAAEGSVNLTMRMDAEYGFNIIARYFGLMMNSEIEKSFDEGLENIRKICENGMVKAAKGEYLITETWQNEQPYLSIRDTATMSSIADKFATNYGRIGMVMQKQGAKMAGPVFSLIHQTGEIMELEWCVPVAPGTKGEGEVKLSTLSAGKILKADYYGPYEKSDPAYAAIEKYAAEKKLTTEGLWREVYITDPTKDPDPAHWLTYIIRSAK